MLGNVSQIYAKSRELSEHQKLLDEQVLLLGDQMLLGIEYFPTVFADLSLSETLYKLIVMTVTQDFESKQSEDVRKGINQKIVELVRKFRVPDKRFYYLKIKAFVECERWDLLHRLANDRKPPIGYVPFARAMMKGSRPVEEVEGVVDRIEPTEDRYEFYITLHLFEKAARVGERVRSERMLNEVYRKCQDPSLRQMIDEMRNNM